MATKAQASTEEEKALAEKDALQAAAEAFQAEVLQAILDNDEAVASAPAPE